MTGIFTDAIVSAVLTKSQLQKLRRAPLTGANRLQLAMSLPKPRITQVQLAAAVDLSQPYVSAICNGAYSEIPLETTRALAQFFGCAIEDLFPARQAVAS